MSYFFYKLIKSSGVFMSLIINSLQQATPSIIDRFFKTLTNLDKRIIAVVGIALALIGAIFLLVLYFRDKKNDQVEDKEYTKKNEGKQETEGSVKKNKAEKDKKTDKPVLDQVEEYIEANKGEGTKGSSTKEASGTNEGTNTSKGTSEKADPVGDQKKQVSCLTPKKQS